MKTLTVWQPWASLIVMGVKTFETRGWETKYRGKIAIHAAKKDPCKMPLLGMEKFEKIADKAFEEHNTGWCVLPRGAIIGTADLVNCWLIVYHPGTNIDLAKHISIGAELDVPKHHPDFDKYIVPSETELILGDWTPGRYAWELKNVVMFDEPIEIKGQQGLWNWDENTGVGYYHRKNPFEQNTGGYSK